MKNITIKPTGSGKFHDLTIRPGTTVDDALHSIGLAGHSLTRDGGQTALNPREDLYKAADEGEKFEVAPDTTVGCTRMAVRR